MDAPLPKNAPAHAVCVEQLIPFHDCDPLFVVWHGRYFQYLEASLHGLLRSCQLDVPDLMEHGLRMYITEVRCRYLFPLTYGETVRSTAWFTQYSPLIKVVYDVFNVTRMRKSARSSATVAVTDHKGTLLTDVPPIIRDRLPELRQ